MDFRSSSKPGMVLSRRASRPCDVCGKERARWYCAADEAYLCERCDASVHSANSVARRHERVKLGPNGAPMKIERKRNDPSVHRKDESLGLFVANKSWQQGSRKRSQTTYPRPVGDGRIPPLPAVKKADPIDEEAACLLIPKPEPCTPSSDPDADFLYPASTNQCSGSLKNEPASPEDGNPSGNITNLDFGISNTEDGEFAHEVPVFGQEDELADEVPVYEPLFEELLTANQEDFMEGILPTTVPAYDERSWTEPERTCKVETFLDPGSGLCEGELDDMGGTIEDGSISIEGVSGLDEFDVFDLCTSSGLKSENCNLDLPEIEMWRSPLECSNGTDGQDCIIGPNPFKGKGERQLESGIVKLEQDSDCMAAVDTPPPSEPAMEIKERILHKTISLRLNYEDVLSAWSDRGSFWTDGRKPQTVPDDSIFDIASLEVGIVPELSNTSSQAGEQPGQVPVIEQSSAGAAREARVMRYREKRRTRLFSKKIRYEVRKLNAERRPRMKGRFVKRSSPGL